MRSAVLLLVAIISQACVPGEELGPELTARVACPRERLGDGVCDAVCADPDPDCAFHVIGHRGSPHQAAENTLPALRAAIADGANALEIDLVVTADQEVVVWHDRDPDDLVALARQGGLEELPWIPWNPELGDPMRRPVDELTLGELREHYGYARSVGPYGDITTDNVRDPRALIPTLDEVTSWARRQPTLAAVYFDVKLARAQPHLAPLIARAIAAETEHAVYEVFVLSPHDTVAVAFRDWFRAHRPDHRARVVLDHEEPGALEPTVALGLDAITIGKTILHEYQPFVATLAELLQRRDDEHPHIRPIVAWTFDDPDELRELYGLGVDGIMTNRPAELAGLVRR